MDPNLSIKYISIEEKKKLVTAELDYMAHTMAIRVGKSNTIKMATEALMNQNKNLSYDQAHVIVIEWKVATFMYKDLNMDKETWDKTRKVTFVTFQQINDIAVVNSHLRNLDPNSSNKLFQFVPTSLLTRFKAYENAAIQIRNDSNNTVNYKIRPGYNDFYLLIRKKGCKDAWSGIQRTPIPVDMNASFEVGKLSPEERKKEKEYLKELASHNTMRKNEYKKSTYNPEIDWNEEGNDNIDDLFRYINIPNAV